MDIKFIIGFLICWDKFSTSAVPRTSLELSGDGKKCGGHFRDSQGFIYNHSFILCFWDEDPYGHKRYTLLYNSLFRSPWECSFPQQLQFYFSTVVWILGFERMPKKCKILYSGKNYRVPLTAIICALSSFPYSYEKHQIKFLYYRRYTTNINKYTLCENYLHKSIN